ncbi:MAG: flavin monoamine oxidase family protein [Corynebacterium sp.]|uniref:flavin monoamine oxidase family protein n=1 Tax=unclassified Corynebacterium TaxID=2624378 RepID=UPI00095C821E|nr:FAD-dependent oxidoreductase [Corynebacterium sp. CNJ-954]OLT53701.1 hypothetical protein BJF89_02475 [Corynebacterium sp. CNJ-954]
MTHNDTPTIDVIIIGAGMAGLTAAAELHRRGSCVLCLEARDRVGGRAYSRSVGENGEFSDVVDLGATWYWPGEETVAQLIQDLGVATFDHYTAGDALLQGEIPGQVPDGVHRLRGNMMAGPSKRFTDGAQALADALRDSLPTEAVRTGAVVTAVTDTGTGVEVSAIDERDGTTVVYSAASAILAVPPALAVDGIAFSPGLDDALVDTARRTPVWMGGVVKAVATYSGSPWRARGLAGTAMSRTGPFTEIQDLSDVAGSTGRLFGFAQSEVFHGVGRTEIQDAFLRQLVAIFGDEVAHPTDVLVIDWNREKFTSPQGIRGYGRTALPSDPSAMSYGQPVFTAGQWEGRLQWASTEIDDVFGGHMEGACRAGLRAADAVTGDRSGQ